MGEGTSDEGIREGLVELSTFQLSPWWEGVSHENYKEHILDRGNRV